MRLKWIVFCVLIFTLVFSSFSPIKSRNSYVLPNYFIAIHNEPFNVGTKLNSNGDELLRQDLSLLTNTANYAYERGIKLTLMFYPKWINLDGYSNYSAEIAKKQCLQQIYYSKKQVKSYPLCKRYTSYTWLN
ncbi:MAG: hypothetical protein KAH01_03730 [Caldisericia bacterium]|nr:hypothetical protein [Caldisericia bacterium]